MKKALLVGINYIATPSIRLNGCIDDIKNMSNMLIDAYSYDKKNIYMLRDDQPDSSILPTRANILQRLKALIAESSKLEEIWFHYSGHGAQIKDTNRDEVDGMDDVIVPCDYNTTGFIVDDDFFSIIKNTKCRTILMFDSCHSGTVSDLQWSFEYKSGITYQRTLNNRQYISNPNIYMMSGCKDNQTSADVYDNIKQEYFGAFTNAFLTCLRNSGHNIKMLELYRNICVYLVENGYAQKPIFSTTNSMPTYVITKSLPIVPITKPIASPVLVSSIIKKNMKSMF